jgi:hypothetical protein
MREFVKIAEDQAAPAKGSANMANLLKLLAVGGLGYGGYKMYQGHKDDQARQAALAAAAASQSANRKKMLLGGALGAGALGAAHHFGLGDSIMEKLKGSSILEKIKGLFGGGASKAPLSIHELDPYGIEDYSPHHEPQYTQGSALKVLPKILNEGGYTEKVGPNAMPPAATDKAEGWKLGPKY